MGEMTQAEIELVGEIDAHSARLRSLVQKVRALPDVDQRWASIGATDLQTGLMALIRAVARPDHF